MAAAAGQGDPKRLAQLRRSRVDTGQTWPIVVGLCPEMDTTQNQSIRLIKEGESLNLLEPFRAAFYQPPQAVNERCVAPPYDIVSPEEHRQLLGRSPYNVIRFTLGENPGEPGRFDTAAATLQRLVRTGVIGVDDRPRLYGYTVRYRAEGEELSFVGLVGAIDLVTARVFSHERTMSDVKEGRLRALAGTRANLGLILLAGQDEGRLERLLEQGRGRTRVDVSVKPGERHGVFDLNEECYDEIAQVTEPLDFVIADGHHRFQTAQRYWELNPEDSAARYCLVVLGSLASPSGLQILPTHRVITFSTTDAARSWAAGVRRALPETAEDAADVTLYVAGAADGVGLRFNSREESLVAFLHRMFIDDLGAAVKLSYVQDLEDAVQDVRSGRPVVAVRLRAVTPAELMRTVMAGDVFPPKSTYFYPKLYSGLLMRFLDTGRTES